MPAPQPPESSASAEGVRVSKLITERGLASGREADEWIAAGWVRVNGLPAVLGQRVLPHQKVEVHKQARADQALRVTVLMHKPVGYVSGQAEAGHEPATVLAALRHCQRCNTFTESEICARCLSSKREPSLLCVVETPVDMNMLEQTHAYSGLYYVLMGRVSPLDGIGPGVLHLERLLARACDGVVREVIIATNYTNEGEATAHYLSEMLRSRGVTVSRIARGVPVGGELEYVDAGTLAQALLERRPLAV